MLYILFKNALKNTYLCYYLKMKEDTHHKHIQIANDIMFYIYVHIDTDIKIDELSEMIGISKFHMQRIFKEVFHRNIHESVKLIRLQKASNLLLTNRYASISKIANLCGYSSQSSFIKAFKQRFSMTPTKWKEGGYLTYSSKILAHTDGQLFDKFDILNLQPTILKQPAIQSYYIRNLSYNPSEITMIWQKLNAWVLENDINQYEQIALFHDNPAITPLSSCQYVACIATYEKVESKRLPKFEIAEGLYAKFDIELKKGEILSFIQWVYHRWLPKSDFSTSTKPSYAIYKKNAYLNKEKDFVLEFYLPVQF